MAFLQLVVLCWQEEARQATAQDLLIEAEDWAAGEAAGQLEHGGEP